MLKRLLRLFGLESKQEKEPVEKVQKRVKLKGKIVANKLIGRDAEFMYRGHDDEPGLCPVCHNTLKKIPDLGYCMQKKKGDLFCTYDDFYIVTEKFRRFCNDNGYEGLSFVPLPKSPGYYYFEAYNIFKLDTAVTKFTNKRECCGSYDEIILPSCYKAKSQYICTDDFICRSEYSYGSFNRKSPDIIVGTKTVGKMRQFGLSGIYFENVREHP